MNDADGNQCAVVERTKVKIADHIYESRFIISDIRYGVILGMPWYHDTNPGINYKTKMMKVGSATLYPKTMISENLHITNVSVRRFKKLMKDLGTEVFAVVINSIDTKQFGKATEDALMKEIIQEYSEVFKSQLPPGLPPKRAVDHEIMTETSVKIPNHRLFRLSPEELRATRDYIDDNLKNGSIRLSKSPYGAALFFAKAPGTLKFVQVAMATRRNFQLVTIFPKLCASLVASAKKIPNETSLN